MRQLGDLAIWVGMIVLAVSVIYYTPVVAEYVTSESKPQLIPTSAAPRMQQSGFHPHPYGERHAAR